MSNFQLFIPLTKVDLAKREVWGVGAVEQVDKTGKEIFDYAASKPHIQQWSTDALTRTTELAKTAGADVISLGNIREMHNDIAAGKVIALNFNDKAKQVELGTKVVDDGTWEKVQKGVLTGFSIGGSYGKTWIDGAYKRYEALPAEFSYVDNPCIPDATFTVVKADGATELRKFAPPPDPKSVIGDSLKKLALAKSFAGSFQDGNLSGYMQMEHWDIEGALNVLSGLCALICSEQAQAGDEGDDIALLGQTMKQVVEFLSGEIDEMLEAAGQTGQMLAMAAKIGGLTKAGARHSATDNSMIQDIHDRALALGAACPMSQEAEKAMRAEDLKKVQEMIDSAMNGDPLKKIIVDSVAAAEPLQKMTGANTEQAAALAKVVTQSEELLKQIGQGEARQSDFEKRLKAMEDQPDPRMPARLNLNIMKRGESGNEELDADATIAAMERFAATADLSPQARHELNKAIAFQATRKVFAAGPQRIGVYP